MTQRFDLLLHRSTLGSALTGAMVVFALGLAGCSDEDHPVVPEGSGCLDCHSDQARLQATADPDEEPQDEDPGEG
jgi:hypothetical protein